MGLQEERMRIIIEEPKEDREDEIIIRCRNLNDEMLQIIARLRLRESMVTGYLGESIMRVPAIDIFYFESVEGKVFLYTQNQVYESRQKLYEIENEFKGSDFLRISKSAIVNIKKIRQISPDFSGRFEALLKNGEKIIISRQYVPSLKRKLGVSGRGE